MSEQGGPAAVLSDHLVAYIDLLGFRSVIGAIDQTAARDVLSLLQELYDVRGDFAAAVQHAGNGSSTASATPAVTAFSDNIVLSFDLAKLQATGIGVYTALMMLRGTAARIAHRARAVGCLIRGGIAIGPLYHRGGVVFGRALVEAYRLESEIAEGPRLIIDHPALETVQGNRAANGAMYCDTDGYWCLDYMTGDLQDVDDALGSRRDAETCHMRTTWARHIRNEAVARANSLQGAGCDPAALKWRLFAARFEASMATVNGHWFNMDGSPLSFLDNL